MARTLGMNPRKLPGLRPSPQERWKLPVGEFIEERYRQRFGGNARDHDPRGPEPSSRKASSDGGADASPRPAHARLSRRGDRERTFHDHEIPF
jgi:hypothetical protein